jgi:hypothetical protein
MPSLSPHIAKTTLSRALATAMLSGVCLLTGCGSENPTTRTSNPTGTPTDPENVSYSLAVRSPVTLQNVRVRVIDAASSTEIGNQILSSGTLAQFNIPKAYAENGTVLIAEVSPVSSSSSYYDVALDRMAPMTSTLHGVINMSTRGLTMKVDPFSEAAYQRALVRAGNLDPDNIQASRLTTADISTANQELNVVFRVRGTTFAASYGSRADLSAVTIDSTNAVSFRDTVFSVGHYALYHQRHPNDPSPYLGFGKHIAIDFKDGDLDGLTVYGQGDFDDIYLNDPLVTPILNNNPERNTKALLAIDQLPARQDYNAAHGDAAKAIFLPFYAINSQDYQWIIKQDFVESISYGGYELHSAGAGNYTRAYGLEAGEVQSFLNVDDSRQINMIEQLIGHHDNGNGCTLDIYPSGRIVVTQGNLTDESTINRELTDSLSRPDANSNQYLLNISTPSESLPYFIQIRSTGSTITSVVTGRSGDTIPNQLTQQKITCQF